MNKTIIKKQAEEKLQVLKDHLQKTDISAPASHAEVKELLLKLVEAEKILTVYEYLLVHNEISSDINVHLKIMELAEKNASKKEEILASITEKEVIKPDAELENKTKPSPPIENKQENEVSEQKSAPLKKIEIGINDKYRMINDLFAKSQQELSIAIEQINTMESWSQAKQYLNSLADLYSWDQEKDIVKALYRISKKRFES